MNNPLTFALVTELLLRTDVKERHQQLVSKGHRVVPIVVQMKGKLEQIGEQEQLGHITVFMAPVDLVPVDNLNALQKMLAAKPDQVYVTLIGMDEPSKSVGRIVDWNIPAGLKIAAQASRFQYTVEVCDVNQPDHFFCDYCQTVSESKLQTCGGCRLVRYCNKVCQQLAWAKHKSFCPLYQQIQ